MKYQYKLFNYTERWKRIWEGGHSFTGFRLLVLDDLDLGIHAGTVAGRHLIIPGSWK